MSARRALPGDVDAAALSDLAANAAARRALDNTLHATSGPRRATSGEAVLATSYAPTRALTSEFLDQAATQLPRRALAASSASVTSCARRALESDSSSLITTYEHIAARALALPARALDEDASGNFGAVACVARRAIDDDTAILPKYVDEAFVKRSSRLKQFAVGLATLALLGGLGSQLGTLGASAQSTSVSAAIAGNLADREDSQVSRDSERQPLSTEPTDDFGFEQQIQAEAEVAREVKAEQEAAAAEAARIQAEADRKAQRDAAVTANIAPGQIAPLSVAEALANAQRLSGSPNYTNMCLALVSNFYGYGSSGAIGAQQAANAIIAAGQMNYDMADIPVGALVWYDGSGIGNPYGHVAMYAGDGMVYSNGHQNGVGLMSIHKASDEWRQPIIGWSNVWLPGATN